MHMHHNKNAVFCDANRHSFEKNFLGELSSSGIIGAAQKICDTCHRLEAFHMTAVRVEIVVCLRCGHGPYSAYTLRWICSNWWTRAYADGGQE